MIRRDGADDGYPGQWLLISQIDHATLAGRLAECWGAGGVAPLSPRDELLWAVYHHDDGWADWEQHPTVDPQTGRPRSFTEMEPDDSIHIWSTSIDQAAAAGPLEGYVVAGHFTILAHRLADWHPQSPHLSLVHAFIERYERAQREWLDVWQRQASGNTPAAARQSLEYLRFFDMLSLWFCCSRETQNEQVEPPGSPPIELLPGQESVVRLAPWPLTVPRLELEIPAKSIAVGHYDPARLAAAPAQTIQLRFHVEPRGEI